MITVDNRIQFLQYVKEQLPDEPLFCGEIGVFNGDFSELIYHLIDPVEMELIDPFESGGNLYDKELGITTAYSNEENHTRVLDRFSAGIDFECINVVKKYSFDAVSIYSDKYFHFLYHDASHLYKDLKRDLSDWLPKMEPQGLVCGHDYGNDLFPGVKQAVDEFCKEYNFEMIIFNENGGDYALRAIQ